MKVWAASHRAGPNSRVGRRGAGETTPGADRPGGPDRRRACRAGTRSSFAPRASIARRVKSRYFWPWRWLSRRFAFSRSGANSGATGGIPRRRAASPPRSRRRHRRFGADRQKRRDSIRRRRGAGPQRPLERRPCPRAHGEQFREGFLCPYAGLDSSAAPAVTEFRQDARQAQLNPAAGAYPGAEEERARFRRLLLLVHGRWVENPRRRELQLQRGRVPGVRPVDQFAVEARAVAVVA